MVLVGRRASSSLLGYTAQRDIHQVLDDRSAAMVTVIEQASSTGAHRAAGHPRARHAGLRRARERSSQARSSARPATRPATWPRPTASRTRQGPSDEERLLGTPFTTPSGDRGVLVVSQETGPYERSEFYALLATVVLGVLVIAAPR